MHRVVLFAVLFFFAVGFVSAKAASYTGCLTKGGDIVNVAIGSLPKKPCNDNQKQISWNEIGPEGPAGPQGEPGPQGPPGEPGGNPHFGQFCPTGQALIGFDTVGNILCSDIVTGQGGVAQFSESFWSGSVGGAGSDRSLEWDAFESQLSSNVFYRKIEFFSHDDPGYTCSNEVVANQICQQIRLQTAEHCLAPTQAEIHSFDCDGDIWTVGPCGGTEVSVNTPFCQCVTDGTGTTIRAENYASCDHHLDLYGSVNGNTCDESAVTMTVRCTP